MVSIGIVIIVSLAAPVWPSPENPRQTNAGAVPSPASAAQVALPVLKPRRTEREVMALKAAEVALGEKLISDFPGHEEAFVIVGNMYHRRGNAVEARKYRLKALQINPRRAEVYVSMGWLSLKKGALEQAIQEYRQALALNPKYLKVRANMGRALMMLGRPAEAIVALKEEVKLSPESSFAYFLLGQAYGQLKDHELARKNYEAALKIQPNHTNAIYGLVTVCGQLGDSEKAREYSDIFKKLKAEERKHLKESKIEYDDYVMTQKNVATTCINSAKMYRNKGDLSQAETLLKQAIGLAPHNVMGYLGLASLYQASNQPAKALQIFTKISEIQPQAAINYLMIGMLSAQTKRWEEAEAAFQTYIRLAPRTPIGYRQLARLYLTRRAKLSLAKQLAGKALSLEASAANYFVLGWACDSVGDVVNALPAAQRAVELDPSNPQYLRLLDVIQQRK